MEIKLKLSNVEHKELLAFCNLNDLLISEVVSKSFITGFNIERYGLLNSGITEEKIIEKEVIVEKRVEIPVEVIKEIVKIEYVEVPVEVIKEVIREVSVEVPVEKIVTKTEYVSDDTQINELLLKIQQLENTPPQIIEMIKEVNVEVPVEVVREVMVEVIKEVNVEVPVEVIREVIREVRVEVPVEVIVEKENNDSSLKPKFDALQNTVQKLRQEILDKDKLIKEYQNTIDDIQRYQGETKAVYLKGSNLDNKLYK
jgi:hypothetical protein